MIDLEKLNVMQRARYEELQRRRADLERDESMRKAQAAAEADDGDALLEAEEEALAQRQRAVALAVDSARAERAYKAAVKKHGQGLVGRIMTDEGVIVLHCMGQQKMAEVAKRSENLSTEEQNAVGWDALRAVIDHPDAETVERLDATYPNLRLVLAQAHNQLAQAGARVITGKG